MYKGPILFLSSIYHVEILVPCFEMIIIYIIFKQLKLYVTFGSLNLYQVSNKITILRATMQIPVDLVLGLQSQNIRMWNYASKLHIGRSPHACSTWSTFAWKHLRGYTLRWAGFNPCVYSCVCNFWDCLLRLKLSKNALEFTQVPFSDIILSLNANLNQRKYSTKSIFWGGFDISYIKRQYHLYFHWKLENIRCYQTN